MGPNVSYKLNEPWEGLVKSNDFVYGATEENLLKLFSWPLENHRNKNIKVILPEKLYEEKIIY